MDSRRTFLERLLHSKTLLQRDTPGTLSERVVPGETERRRRFLLHALASGVGLVALRNSGLAAALQVGGGSGEPLGCTTTLTYTTSFSNSTTQPSQRSWSYSGTATCDAPTSTSGTYKLSGQTATFGVTGTWDGTTYTCIGEAGTVWTPGATVYYTETCANGVMTFTVSHPSHGTVTMIVTQSGKVTATINVPCCAPDGDGDGSLVRPALPAILPPTIDAERPVHDPRSRFARDFQIDFGSRS
jgi:hypothetical protein